MGTTNDADNSISVTCTSTITVADVEDPQVVCPPNTILEPAFCNAEEEPTYVFTDNCPFTIDDADTTTDLGGGNTLHQVLVTDSSGRTDFCQYVIQTLNPFTFPNCPAGGVYSAFPIPNDPGKCSAFINVEPEIGTFPEDCTSYLLTNYPEEGHAYPVGDTAYLAISYDGSAYYTCSFTISVEDIDPPTIECPEDVQVDTTESGVVVFFADAIARDNCIANSVVSSTPESGSFFTVGTTTVTYTIDDGANTPASCTFDVVVNQVTVLPSPVETPAFIPCPSPSNSESNANPPSPSASRSRTPSPSSSSSPSRSPSATPSPNPSIS